MLEPFVGPISKDLTPPKVRRQKSVLDPRMDGMAVGDSFETNLTNEAARQAAKRLGIRIITRSTGGGHIRVWRIE